MKKIMEKRNFLFILLYVTLFLALLIAYPSTHE